jgi:hypothetical protein
VLPPYGLNDQVSSIEGLVSLKCASSIRAKTGYHLSWTLQTRPSVCRASLRGFAKLAKDANAYERLDNIDTLATDFWCAINPPHVRDDIRTDGLENWWKKKHRSKRHLVEFTATEAFIRLALFLNDVGIPLNTRNRTGIISGIIQLGSVETVHRNGGNVAAIKWRPNPELSRLITGGEGVTPHYMVVNHASMFGYGGTERNVCQPCRSGASIALAPLISPAASRNTKDGSLPWPGTERSWGQSQSVWVSRTAVTPEKQCDASGPA